MRYVLTKVTEGSLTYFNCPHLKLISGTKIKLRFRFMQVSKLYFFVLWIVGKSTKRNNKIVKFPTPCI
jgi:hypothetical protein